MLFLIGLGLGSEKDITVRGFELVQNSSHVYLEYYTSIIGSMAWNDIPMEYDVSASNCKKVTGKVDSEILSSTEGFQSTITRLESFFKKPIKIADRAFVESAGESDFNNAPKPGFELLELAKTTNVSLLVVGDPLTATTHTDLLLRCKKCHISYQVVHNASIMTAIGSTGLSLYKFGPAVSIPFFTETWKPSSFYSNICKNLRNGAHTLCLLDIAVKERTMRSMLSDGKIDEWLPPRFMTLSCAIKQLLEIEETEGQKHISPETIAIGVARLGSDNAKICVGSLQSLSAIDMGPPLHSLIIPCHQALDSVELEALELHEAAA